jgi:hypothetical protein
LVHFGWRKVNAFMVKDVQDSHPLRRHTVAAGAELRGVLRGARHTRPYCKFLQQYIVYASPSILTLKDCSVHAKVIVLAM